MKNGVYVYEGGKLKEYLCPRMLKNEKIVRKVKLFLSKNQDKKCVYLKDGYIEIAVCYCPTGTVAIIPNCPPTYDIFKDSKTYAKKTVKTSVKTL